MPRNTQPSRRSRAATLKNTSRILETARLEDVFFGKVIRNLGGSQMQVKTQEGDDALARIPGALSHRTATPIRTGDLVILLPWDFEVRTDKSKRRFEIFAVIHDKKLIREHIREGRIPGWMLEEAKDAEEAEMAEAIEFDYGLDGDGDENDVDIDKI
jgi:initiation factor 1A